MQLGPLQEPASEGKGARNCEGSLRQLSTLGHVHWEAGTMFLWEIGGNLTGTLGGPALALLFQQLYASKRANAGSQP